MSASCWSISSACSSARSTRCRCRISSGAPSRCRPRTTSSAASSVRRASRSRSNAIDRRAPMARAATTGGRKAMTPAATAIRPGAIIPGAAPLAILRGAALPETMLPEVMPPEAMLPGAMFLETMLLGTMLLGTMPPETIQILEGAAAVTVRIRAGATAIPRGQRMATRRASSPPAMAIRSGVGQAPRRVDPELGLIEAQRFDQSGIAISTDQRCSFSA